VGEKLPAEIAIAVAAQLLLARQAAAAPLAERQHGSADMTAMDRTEALPDLSAALTAAAGCGAPGCSADCGASPRPAPGRAAVLDSATAPSR
jgi:hypothetical protein